MTIAQFIKALKSFARPKHDWIVLGNGSICIRDHINADPINVVAISIDPTYAFRLLQGQDDDGEEARRILGMTEGDYTDISNEISGDSAPGDPLRIPILKALNMKITQ